MAKWQPGRIGEFEGRPPKRAFDGHLKQETLTGEAHARRRSIAVEIEN